MKISAIIVARKGSVRIKSKSLSILDDETLIARKVRQLKACKLIDEVIIGSNSHEMLEEGERCGAIPVLREEFFCDESRASANDMLWDMASKVETDLIVWTHCTNPFLSTETYDRAVQTYLDNLPEYDSLLSVLAMQEHLWGPDKVPLNYNPWAPRHQPARELPTYYMQDGGIFIQPREAMLKNRYFFGEKPFLFEIPKEEFCDINDEQDLLHARAMVALRKPFV